MKAFETAKWIWNKSCVGVNTYAQFSIKFNNDTGKIKLRIACDGNYMVHLNGELVDFGQFPGYEDMQYFDELELSSFLVAGENTLTVDAHHPGKDTSTYRNSPAGVIFELISGGKVVYSSSAATASRPSPSYLTGDSVGMVSGQLGYTFGLDLTKPGADFTDSYELSRSYEFEPRPIKKLEIFDRTGAKLVGLGDFTDTEKEGTAALRMYRAQLKPREFDTVQLPSEEGLALAKQCDGAYAIFDLGSESTGFMSLDIEVEAECELLFGWGEHLTDGRVRAFIGYRNFAASIKLPKGRHKLENPLLRLGLRYVELHVYGDCKLYYAGIKPTLYPLAEPTPAPITDGIHKAIYDTCVKTLHLCMHEHYEDCPWREQALYSMDSRNQMLCGYRVFGETEFARASLRLMAHSIREDDLLELCSPARVSITIPSFSAIFPMQVREYLDYSGDEELVRELLPTCLRIGDMFVSRIEENGLIRSFGQTKDWNFYEWQEGLSGSIKGDIPEEKRTFDAPLCAFVLMGLSSLATLCDMLGNDRAEYYREACERLKKSMQAFWDEERGCYASFILNGEISHYCELTNALMLYSDAVPMNRVYLTRKALKDGKLLPFTLSHSVFKYDALLDDEENVGYVLDDVAAKWGYMLEKGATTFWETIEGENDFSEAGSLCHGWSAIPAHLYFRIANMGEIKW